VRFRPVSTKTWCRSHLPACSTLGRGWGRSVDGQFGYGVDEIASFSTPVAMTGLLGNAVQVSTSSAATCVLLDDGRAMCSGRVPRQVPGVTGRTATPVLIRGR